jgi:uncharacterized protein
MMMSLGLFLFTLPTIVYQDLSHKIDVRFARGERIGAPDAFQFIGPGDETISLSGVTAHGINHPNASFALLRTLMREGKALPLIDGLGNMFGMYIIENIDRKKSNFRKFGQARTTDWAIDLQRVDNPGGEVRNIILDKALGALDDPQAMALNKLSIASLPGVTLPGLV